MSCQLAMITDVMLITQEKSVAEAMTLFEKHRIKGLPVVDSEGKLIGLFTLVHLLKRLLPDVAVLENLPRVHHFDVSLGSLSGSMSDVAARLVHLKELNVGDLMVKPDTVRADMPLQEGIRLLVKYGSPIPVIESDSSHKLTGIITSQSIIKALNTIQTSGK